MSVSVGERRARMLLSWIAEPGDVDACALVPEFGAEALLARLLEGAATDLPEKASGWRSRAMSVDAEGVIRAGDSVGARYLCPGDAEWPEPVGDLRYVDPTNSERRAGCPFGLWVRGSGDLGGLADRAVAIVGARAATAYGEHVAGSLALGCGAKGWSVVSGGAYGIDAAAHSAALAAGQPTLAVLAGGVDRLYPSGNSPLLRRILDTGVVVSEAAPGCAPSRSRFLVRNRLIAALGKGTVVVEAALRSGSLNTARWAQDLDRLVMGVPGPVTSVASAGVHELLRQPGTLLVTAADEIVEHVSPAGTALAARRVGDVRPLDALDEEARRTFDAVPVSDAASAESIAVVAALPPGAVETALRRLRVVGLVEPVGADRWRLAGSTATASELRDTTPAVHSLGG